MYCGEEGFWWECREHSASSSFPLDCSNTADIDLKPFLSGGVTSIGKTLRDWEKIVTLYTSAKLTSAEDELVAIAGIARVAYETNSHEYIAGMWKPWLLKLLCWRHHGHLCPKPKVYRAPTWSWAAVDGETRYNTNVIVEEYTHVLHTNVIPAGTDSFGKIVAGVLTLCCSILIPGTLQEHDTEQDHDFIRTVVAQEELHGSTTKSQDLFFKLVPARKDNAKELPFLVYFPTTKYMPILRIQREYFSLAFTKVLLKNYWMSCGRRCRNLLAKQRI